MPVATNQILSEIAEIAGWEVALKLVSLVGGTSIRIPAEAPDEHWLTVALGKDATAKLCTTYAGSFLWIPKNAAEITRFRNQQIAADRTSGMTITRIALKYKLTDRQIYNVLGSVEE